MSLLRSFVATSLIHSCLSCLTGNKSTVTNILDRVRSSAYAEGACWVSIGYTYVPRNSTFDALCYLHVMSALHTLEKQGQRQLKPWPLHPPYTTLLGACWRIQWLNATLWERSAAEHCLIHAETVSLFRSLVAFQPMLKVSQMDHFR